MLTLNDLKEIKAGEVFAHGVITNSRETLNMVGDNQGKNLIWAAKKGYGYDDWAIYTAWEDQTPDIVHVLAHGEKVKFESNIKKLVPCDKEALNLYRF